jgi:hypothetical protein
MVRNIIGSVLALIGAAAAVYSPFRSWFNGREGSDIRVADLFNGISNNGSGDWESIMLPFLFAALVTLAGVLLRSRLLVLCAAIIVLGFTVLWMVRQGQAANGLAIARDGSGLGWGVASAVGGSFLLFIAAAVMTGRQRRVRRTHDDVLPRNWEPQGAGDPHGSSPYGEPSAYQEPSAYGQQPQPPQYGEQQQYGQPPQYGQSWDEPEQQYGQQPGDPQAPHPPQDPQDPNDPRNPGRPHDGDTQSFGTPQQPPPWDQDPPPSGGPDDPRR